MALVKTLDLGYCKVEVYDDAYRDKTPEEIAEVTRNIEYIMSQNEENYLRRLNGQIT